MLARGEFARAAFLVALAIVQRFARALPRIRAQLDTDVAASVGSTVTAQRGQRVPAPLPG